jgi:hypothetical protein
MIDRGEVVDPTSYYFRINPLFETASAKYDWINRVIVGFAVIGALLLMLLLRAPPARLGAPGPPGGAPA